MSTRDDIERELDGLDEATLRDVLRLIQLRKRGVSETALLAEATLARDWLTPEEDARWAHL